MRLTKNTHFLLAMVLVLALAGSAASATISVTNTQDNLAGSLRQAIQDANPDGGDTIVFQIPTSDPGYNASTGIFTIGLTTAELVIDKDLTIDGGGQKIVVERSHAANTAQFRVFAVQSRTVTISNLTISNGRLYAASGGGISNGGTLTLKGCTLSDNFSDGANSADGAALYNAAVASIQNCTFTRNDGADVKCIINAGTSLIMRSCTVLGNTTYAGVVNTNDSPFHMGNSIVVGNGTWDVIGKFISDGHNFIGSYTNTATGFGATGDQTARTSAEANLGPLQDNGGPTKTMRPNPGSKVIDFGNRGLDENNQPINTDQRGSPRPVDFAGIKNVVGGDGSDIGAVEVGQAQSAPTFTVTNTANHTDADGCTVDDCTLGDAVARANAEADANTIIFSSNVSGVISSYPSAYGITSPVAINGPGAAVLTISGEDHARVFAVTSGGVTISNLTIADGLAVQSNGGAITNSGELVLENCIVSGNTVVSYNGIGGNGGAIHNFSNATLTMMGCTLDHNRALFSGDGANVLGGGIYNEGTLSASNCSFSFNGTDVHGGAIYSTGGGASGNAVVTLANCTLNNNTAEASGGGIFVSAYTNGHATTTLTNCTLEHNEANGFGGAIYNDGAAAGNAALTLTNCTLNGNTATGVGGGIVIDGANTDTSGVSTLHIRNTILRTGASGGNLVNDGGSIISEGNNLSNDNANGTYDSAGPGGFLNAVGDIRNTDPNLAALADNGGPTKTIALMEPSAAIDGGNDSFAPSKDQRDFPRVGVSDIGAFEFGSVLPTPTPIPTPTPSATATASPTPPTLLGNISTRLRVETGDNVLIGGFIVTGTQDKNVIIRARGPSLQSNGEPVPGRLENPTLELYSGQTLLASNDNWIDSPDKQAIIDSTIPPTNDMESAIIASLPANGAAYTAIVRGAGETTGVGLVEVYDLDATADSKLANISTRGLVQTGANVMIGGFIVLGQNAQRVIVRAIGPSLPVAGALADPTLEIYNGNGVLLAQNDNWRSDQEADIIATTVPPSSDLESAIVGPATPGNYTAIVRGVNDTTGVALVEVYALN